MEKIEKLRLKMQNGGHDLTYQDMKVAIDAIVAIRRIKMVVGMKPERSAISAIEGIVNDFISGANLNGDR